VPDSPWTTDHRDVLLRRITMLTAGTAAVGAVGAVGLGALFGTQTVAAKSTQPVVVRQAAAPTTARATTSDEAVSPKQVQVRVLNGTGVAGAARAAAGDLTAQGFTVVGVGNAPGGTVSATTISYATGELGAARTLAGLTGVSALVADGPGSVVVLTVGPDWTGSTPAPQRVRSQPSNTGSSNTGSSNSGPAAVSGGS
jgi:hypothetical protein